MPIQIFFCYAHEDEPFLNNLKTHLRPLQREGLIDVWYDHDISAGTEWEQEIRTHLNEAQIVLLLVSPDFIDSDYCYGIEMQRALERHNCGEAIVIPVILRHVYWRKVLGKLQALPIGGKPVKSWLDEDEAFFNVVTGIRKIVVERQTSLDTVPEERQLLKPLIGQEKTNSSEPPHIFPTGKPTLFLQNIVPTVFSSHSSRMSFPTIVVASAIIVLLIGSSIAISSLLSKSGSILAGAPTATVPSLATLSASLSNPYPPHTGILALNHSLTEATSIWDASSHCQFTKNAYHVKTANGFTSCMYNTGSYLNLTYQVQMRFLTLDTCGGIILRNPTSSLVNQYYQLYICTDGTYHFGVVAGIFTSLAHGSSLFNTVVKQPNVIAVVAKGTQFVLYVNGQMVNSVSDPTISDAGQIGLFAENLVDTKTNDEVVFNDVKVWTP